MPWLDSISDLHFIRPWVWLASLPLIVILIWQLRQFWQQPRNTLFIAPHLRAALNMQQPNATRQIRPLLLFALVYLLLITAAAGPTYQQQPSPFLQDQALTVVVIKLTDSMTQNDIQPSRLQRAIQKLEDLMVLRHGAPHALVVYAGSAHLVMPATRDANAILYFAKALSPELMPTDGDHAQAAWNTAASLIKQNGSIVWFSDSALDLKPNAMLNPIDVHWLPITGATLSTVSSEVPIKQYRLTADNEDVNKIASSVDRRWHTPEATTEQQWQDMGYWLTPVIAILLLFWFRPGWVIHYER